jgi:hypothetical protein
MHALLAAAALLAAGALAAASHESAAILHGLDLLERPPESLVTLTRPPHAGVERDQLLRDAGYKVVHFTWRQHAFARPSPV